ncbi:hypothetical protein ACFQ15_03265 [Sphingomonas hankookensis]|uniref:hypothetical protein n=1 Tax=Sphingomonas hankookensis TaxID=563996 RepID=UPI001F55B7AE|nr:hypothetical protein [Sphingomonas hankookensis]
MWMALALIQAAATPLPAGVEEDLWCIAVISTAAASAPADQQPGLVGGMMYYMGRVDRVVPGIDYAVELRRLLDAKDADATISAAAKRCGTKLQDVGGSMQRWGKALQQKDGK